MCKCTPNIRTPFCGKPSCEWPGEARDHKMSGTRDCGHSPPNPCWTCQLERSNRELADENRSLRDQLQVADEQCHEQVADAVRSRDAAWARCRELEKEKDEAFHAADERAKQLAKFVAATEEARHRHFMAMRMKQNEVDHAQSVARRYFQWIRGEECPDLEFTESELAKHPWLKEAP